MQEKRLLRDALNWLVHLHHGVSKGGDVIDEETGERIPIPVTDSEWKAALEEAKAALASTTDETEMEKLVAWIQQEYSDTKLSAESKVPAIGATVRARRWWKGYRRALEKTLAYITTQFGEEEEDEL